MDMNDLDYARDIEPVYAALKPVADPFGWNGPAFCLLVLELKKAGKPVGEITLNEFAAIADKVGEKYNSAAAKAERRRAIMRDVSAEGA